MFVFELKTLPVQSISESVEYRFAKNQRFLERSSLQFTGVEQESITLTGILYPEITGGRVSLELFRRQADLGVALPLINGSGLLLGFYVTESIQSEKSELFADGAPRKITFTFSLKKTDPPPFLPQQKLLKML